ncbi:MAG: single-stranded-DNA-specific exonuclease RecJ, partial [Patescibacteria group bacterium]|nr:single-stranded-DNA-specific exonuclease RecJ [Patescibacteria group bacterium]
IEKAVGRILKARKKNEKIRIFGDYDADGILATAIMYLALREINCDVDYHLPHRIEDGYGLHKGIIDEAAEDKVGLLITVDCGVTNIKEVDYANTKKIDVIVTDHHALTTDLPKAFAIINPRRLNEDSELVGAAVAFRLAEALLTEVKGNRDADKWLRWNADLAAIATVADCAPLFNENRTLVHFGLKTIAANKRPGLKVLFEISNTDPADCSSDDLGFRIAPRINAAGRVAHPEDAIKLLLSADGREARQYAENLQRMNNDRQKLTRNAVESAVSALGDSLLQNALIIHSSPNYHPGIIGLVAGRLTDKYGRPAIVCEERENIIVGSCRSIPEWHIARALSSHANLFERFGGHAQAAGFTALNKNWKEISKRLSALAHTELSGLDLRPKLLLDATLEPRDLNLKVWQELQILEPYGVGNEAPLFYLPSATIIETKKVGSTEAHLKMRVRVGSEELGAIFFGGGDFSSSLHIGDSVELAVGLEKHVWNGWANLELRIADIRCN